MKQTLIESKNNENFKRWMKIIESPRAVKKQGTTLAEGLHLAQVVLQTQNLPVAVILQEKSENSEALGYAQQFADQGVKVYTLTKPLFNAISPVEHGVGIILEIKPVQGAPEDCSESDAIYLDGIQDAGNVGTILRTALASGVRSVYASAKCAQIWSPKVLRAAMGAHFSLRIRENIAIDEVKKVFKGKIYAADAHGARDLFATPRWEEGATLWIFGAEGPGVSPEALKASNERFLIPIETACESLNVAAAAAVVLFEQKRRRTSK